MKRADLGDTDPAVKASLEQSLTRLEMAKTLGQSLIDHQAQIDKVSEDMRRLGSHWPAPEGFLWAITSDTNSFGIVFPTRIDGFLPGQGFAPSTTIRDFEPGSPLTDKDRYVFLADSLVSAGPEDKTPGAVYANGCFAKERLPLGGDQYEVGYTPLFDLPELIANKPLDSDPRISIYRPYGLLQGLNILPLGSEG